MSYTHCCRTLALALARLSYRPLSFMVTESKTIAKVFIASPVLHPGYATRDIDMTITSVCPSVSDTLVCPYQNQGATVRSVPE